MNKEYGGDAKTEMFEDKMNDWLIIVNEKAAKNSQILIELIDLLFGKGIKKATEQEPVQATGFAGIAGRWLVALREIDDRLAGNSRILRKIRKEFK